MFFRDAMKNGIFSAATKGVSREILKKYINELISEFHDHHPSKEYILSKYDKYGSTFSDREIVEEIKTRLVSHLNIVEKEELQPQLELDLNIVEKEELQPELHTVEKEELQPQLDAVEKEEIQPELHTVEKEELQPQLDTVEKEESPIKYIYILYCEGNRFYIGKTKNLNLRFQQHMNGEGSVFTSTYKPISIIEHFEEKGEFDEDNYVKVYMKKYGIDNVRGGSYSNLSLTVSQKDLLSRELIHSENKCFTCGKDGHYSNKCPSTKVKDSIITNTKLKTLALFNEGRNFTEVCKFRAFERATIESHVVDLLKEKHYIKFHLIDYSTQIRNLVGDLIREMNCEIKYLKPIKEFCNSKGYNEITYAHIKYTLALDF